MDEKDAVIIGMGDRIREQIRHNSEIKQQNNVQAGLSGSASADADSRVRLAQEDARLSNLEARKAQEALAQKEALLKEWMHSHFSFRLLSRKYGARLGISDEQRQKDLDDCVLEIAGDKPEFADTKATNAVKKERGIK